jgi:hypothetical protein
MREVMEDEDLPMPLLAGFPVIELITISIFRSA